MFYIFMWVRLAGLHDLRPEGVGSEWKTGSGWGRYACVKR